MTNSVKFYEGKINTEINGEKMSQNDSHYLVVCQCC